MPGRPPVCGRSPLRGRSPNPGPRLPGGFGFQSGFFGRHGRSPVSPSARGGRGPRSCSGRGVQGFRWSRRSPPGFHSGRPCGRSRPCGGRSRDSGPGARSSRGLNGARGGRSRGGAPAGESPRGGPSNPPGDSRRSFSAKRRRFTSRGMSKRARGSRCSPPGRQSGLRRSVPPWCSAARASSGPAHRRPRANHIITASGCLLWSCLNVGSSSSRNCARNAVGFPSTMIVQYAKRGGMCAHSEA